MMRMILWDVPFHILITSTLLFSVFIVRVFSACIHDSIQSDDVAKSVITYEDMMTVQDHRIFTERTKHENRAKRASPDRAYKPIRITISYQDSNIVLSKVQKAILKDVVRKASRLLSVIPVSGKLLLTRSGGCKSSYKRGPNTGKCANVKDGYKGELCADGFKIPDEHLEGLYEYDASNPQPTKTVLRSGGGLSNTDYVLYIKTSSSATCVKAGQNIIAYGAYCQLDQNDRPIAGHINFCPSLFQTSNSKFFDVALHELFHTLGFSKTLFDKFKDCSQPGGQCVTRSTPIRKVLGRMRLVTPSVVKHTSQHYNCTSKNIDFGAILEYQGSSHWDAAFLQGSIMTANIKDSGLTVLDKITLASFEDMGWYKVDFRQADPYTWGRGRGCNFAIRCDKEDDGYFCTTEGEKGCHYRHLNKGVCKSDLFLRKCKIYQTIKDEGRCSNSSPTSINMAAGEIYKTSSRCFVSNLTLQTQTASVPMAGYCYQRRCISNRKLEVRVAGGEWKRCPFGRDIQIKGYTGILKCPTEGVLCLPPPRRPVRTTVKPYITVTPVTKSTTTTPDQPEILCIEITFPTADYMALERDMLLDKFERNTVELVRKSTNVTADRMRNVHLKQGSIIFIFDLVARKTQSDGPHSSEVYEILERLISSRDFTVYLSSNTAFTAALIRSMLPNNATEKANLIPAGGIVGIVLGTMATMALIVAAICLINKYQTAQSRVSPSPSRTPSVDMDDSVSRNTITTLRAISVTHAHSMLGNNMELQQV